MAVVQDSWPDTGVSTNSSTTPVSAGIDMNSVAMEPGLQAPPAQAVTSHMD